MKINSWKKSLHGQYLRNINRKYDNNLAWAWLKLGTIKKETKNLNFAAQEPALQSKVLKVKSQGIRAKSKYGFCEEKDEAVSHHICEFRKIVQTTKLDTMQLQN